MSMKRKILFLFFSLMVVAGSVVAVLNLLPVLQSASKPPPKPERTPPPSLSVMLNEEPPPVLLIPEEEMPPEEEEAPDYRMSEISRLLELVDTPDGLIRGREIECVIKDGAAVVKATYTELLQEAPQRAANMGRMELTVTTETEY